MPMPTKSNLQYGGEATYHQTRINKDEEGMYWIYSNSMYRSGSYYDEENNRWSDVTYFQVHDPKQRGKWITIGALRNGEFEWYTNPLQDNSPSLSQPKDYTPALGGSRKQKGIQNER